jgi:hypothetical protein
VNLDQPIPPGLLDDVRAALDNRLILHWGLYGEPPFPTMRFDDNPEVDDVGKAWCGESLEDRMLPIRRPLPQWRTIPFQFPRAWRWA